MTAYYVERKCYWTDSTGTEYQIGDGGDMPRLFSSKQKALTRAQNMIELSTTAFHFEIDIDNDHYDHASDNSLFGCELRTIDGYTRVVIRVYKVQIS